MAMEHEEEKMGDSCCSCLDTSCGPVVSTRAEEVAEGSTAKLLTAAVVAVH